MIGASIYGIVDYNKTRNKKEFKTMYAAKEVAQPSDEENQPVSITGNIETPAVDKNVSGNKSISGNNDIAKKTNTTVKKQKSRTFSPRLFSRGALDERFIREEKIKEEPKLKTDSVKSENKEQ
jgi:hypothetical protein